MPRRVVLSGELGTDSIDALCRDLSPFHELTSPESIAIDLGELRGISPSALALLICILRGSLAAGRCDPLTNLTAPRAEPLKSWLNAEGLRALLHEDPSDARARATRYPGSCACEAFAEAAQAEQAIRALQAWATARCEMSPLMLWSMHVILLDLAQNVLRHADATEGIMALTVDPASNLMEFAVMDVGIGVRASLAKNREFSSIGDDLVQCS